MPLHTSLSIMHLSLCIAHIAHYAFSICHYSLRTMFKQFISKIPGADVYMVGSFVTFFVFFVLVGLYLLLVDKTYTQRMGRMPLDDSSTD